MNDAQSELILKARSFGKRQRKDRTAKMHYYRYLKSAGTPEMKENVEKDGNQT